MAEQPIADRTVKTPEASICHAHSSMIVARPREGYSYETDVAAEHSTREEGGRGAQNELLWCAIKACVEKEKQNQVRTNAVCCCRHKFHMNQKTKGYIRPTQWTAQSEAGLHEIHQGELCCTPFPPFQKDYFGQTGGAVQLLLFFGTTSPAIHRDDLLAWSANAKQYKHPEPFAPLRCESGNINIDLLLFANLASELTRPPVFRGSSKVHHCCCHVETGFSHR